VFGSVTRDGFEAMVAYTAPVFWLFMLLVGISVFVFRRRQPARELPFRVPLYPITPIAFCLTCAWMVYSSLAYAGLGAIFGMAVLLAGTPLLLIRHKGPRPAPGPAV
jgi:APA family basic amino acid/polyamine antiporter